MKRLSFFIALLFLANCSSRYSTVPLSKISADRKHTAQTFVETLFRKCANEDYTDFTGFNISKAFEKKLVGDSLATLCKRIVRHNGKISAIQLVSAHTPNSPRDFIDVFNFKLSTKKSATPIYLHLGMYRAGNFIEKPLYFSADENYYETIRKKYYRK